MQRFFPHPWGWASLVPILCAVHCAATPLLIVALPALALGEAVELVLLGATVPLAGWAILAGVRRHGRVLPAAAVVLGLGVWAGSLGGAFLPVPEPVSTVLATLTVAGALGWNAGLQCGASTGQAIECSTCGHGSIRTPAPPSVERPAGPAYPTPSSS